MMMQYRFLKRIGGLPLGFFEIEIFNNHALLRQVLHQQVEISDSVAVVAIFRFLQVKCDQSLDDRAQRAWHNFAMHVAHVQT